jgi:hypothetical protein
MNSRYSDLSNGWVAALLGATLMLVAQPGCTDLRPSGRSAGPAAPAVPAGAAGPMGSAEATGPSGRAGERCGGLSWRLSWAKMPGAKRTLWKALGWKPSSWSGAALPPASENTAWHDLSTSQRDAAVKLGCDPTTWDTVIGREELFIWMGS